MRRFEMTFTNDEERERAEMAADRAGLKLAALVRLLLRAVLTPDERKAVLRFKALREVE